MKQSGFANPDRAFHAKCWVSLGFWLHPTKCNLETTLVRVISFGFSFNPTYAL